VRTVAVELGPRILTGPPRSLDAFGGAFSKIQMDLRAVLLDAALRDGFRKMERLELAVKRRATLLRRARALERDRRAGRPGRSVSWRAKSPS